MKNKKQNYADKIQWRIQASWAVLIFMTVYMVVLVELGGGDSRKMTELAKIVSRLVFFGGMVYLVIGIVHNKRLLKNRKLLKEQMWKEQDERNQYLYDKSGGIVVDILLFGLLFLTFTMALFYIEAFYVSFFVLLFTAFLKIATYWFYSHFR